MDVESRQLEVSRATVSDWSKVVEEERIKGLQKNKALEINRRIVADAWAIKLWKMISGDHRWI
jgi:hypothetical protein